MISIDLDDYLLNFEFIIYTLKSLIFIIYKIIYIILLIYKNLKKKCQQRQKMFLLMQENT